MAIPVVQIFEADDYDRQIRRGAELLAGGGVIVLPTETVYGAAAALNRPAGMRRLKDLRSVEEPKPFTIHLARREDAQRYIGPVNDLARRIMKKLWPGPVALILEVPSDRRQQVAAEIGVAESDIYDGSRITLRCPDHLATTDMIALVDGPVVLTLAGSSVRQPTFRVDGLAEELDGKVDLIFDAGPSRFTKPSTILQVKDQGYEIVRSGVYDQRIIERLLQTTILFVCSGNTCRSPMAEAIAKRILAEKLHIQLEELEKKGVSVLSAGSFAMPGARAATPAIEAVKDLGGDLSRHRSRALSVELIHQADMIFTMDRGHAQAVTALVPAAVEKVATLDPDHDIDDPIGGDSALYHQLAKQLQSLIENRLRGNAFLQ